ncbi:LuxR C-terminal-related transcriptional regulator [Paractinoplanes rishiriensis]|uniref:LuxR family transcriptional regulator n=1 Tax=Paractinoplanes rishiriensis TaxID=1050105 RepID=A0A919MUY9_9ACTN|nr:LuxR C-terminal-related transcriptional regulator [Actinoplanes rishiriensis]GIF00837.1 LuxR family transcriptional regulator [Actinoplanes rishiriensis]
MTTIDEAPTAEWRSGPLPNSPAADPSPAGVPALGRQLFHVARPHLLARLDARHTRLTVVSAPAGWGKTTLLASWTHRQRGRAVWVDSGSRAGFWYRLTTAVATGTPIVSGAAATADPADGPAQLAGMLQDTSSPLAIVLDDCNDVASPDALADLAQVVRTSSAPVRLVLACRGTPALPLHRWRMDRQLVTLGEDELAFSVDEAAGLFAGQEVTLPRLAVADLRAQMEGWATGLQLAATALAHRAEPAQAPLDAEAIDLIADYLGAEVLARLDPQVHRILVEASVAERLTAGLLNTLADRVDGAAVLADLQRQGAFIRRCPAPGDWYRLHPMLSRVLYRELSRHDRDRVGRAHGRAGDWHLIQGPPVEALRHLLAAREWERAADVLHRHWPDITIGSRRLDVGPIVTSLPGPDAPPHVVLAMAAERLDACDTASARHLLHLAEADPDAGEPAASIMAAVRLATARLDGQLHRVCCAAAEILAEPAPENSAAGKLRPLALLSLGAAKLHLGQTTEAGQYLGEAQNLARRRDLDHVEIIATSHLAASYAALGHLHDAVRTAREALELASRLGLGQLTDLSWSRLALAEAYFQWDRLDDAWCCTDAALDNSCGDRLIQLSGTILQTRIRVATGRLTEAHEALRAVYHESGTADLPAPARRALALAEAELRLACGDPAAALERLSSWPDAEPLPAQAAVVEGSVLLAEGRPAAASTVVAPYLTRADPGTSLTCRAFAGLVAALAGKATGHRDQVMHGLGVALKVADEEGHRRCFTAGGHAVRALIESVAPAMSAYPPVVAALTATIDPLIAEASGPHLPSYQGAGFAVSGTLVEPLTSRERTMLRYLQGTLSHVEIAAVLCISVNTVKTHVKNIYRKLGAGRRKEAVRLARELRLL